MKNTKLIAILLCVSMLLMAFVGCNAGNDAEETTNNTTSATTEAIVETTEAVTEAPTTEVESETEETTTVATTETTAPETEVTTTEETETTASETETTAPVTTAEVTTVTETTAEETETTTALETETTVAEETETTVAEETETTTIEETETTTAEETETIVAEETETTTAPETETTVAEETETTAPETEVTTVEETETTVEETTLPEEATDTETETETETTTAPETEVTTEVETEATTEEETTVIEYDYESKFVSFVTYKNDTAGSKTLTSSTVLAGKFNVTSGYLEQINVFMGTIGDVTFSLYKWNKDYATTIAGEPLKQKTYLKSEYAKFETVAMLNLELNFAENEVGKGAYLYVLSTPEGSTNYATIYMGLPWNSRDLTDEYKTYATSGFVNGKKSTNEVPQSSYVFKAQVEKTEKVEMPIPAEKDPDGTVKVLLIGGQSNAVGVSQNAELRKKISTEKYQEYKNGYSNVQIMYDNCSGNANATFENTKLGQAVNAAAFGPELGIAEYLATNFPEEQFYIIKYAMGGSVLETQWYNAATGGIGELLVGFTNFVNKGLAEIEAKGLTPKIIGFVWNQGESDAIWLPQSSRYYANQEGLVNYVRTTFDAYASVKGIAFFDAGIVGNIWNAYKNVNMQKYAFSLTSPINFYIETTDYEIINTLEENNDVAHYDSLGMIKLGQLYGAEIAKMLN